MHLLDQLLNLVNDNARAHNEKSVHESQALLLHILVLVSKALDDHVDHGCLVEHVPLGDILKEDECCLSDWSSIVHSVLEWTQVYLSDEFLLDLSLQQGDLDHLLNGVDQDVSELDVVENHAQGL